MIRGISWCERRKEIFRSMDEIGEGELNFRKVGSDNDE